ncbi:DNA-binding FadR family transcriptional regulator [Robertmurraya andreesenii]|uniref:DNA-binding FadR family transcriptional regulator n=2 Tax=Anoxybacillus andreesenii TaxID=1325932 RepID=A0ABT9V8N8_9BACL|nr:GntR family transcriptional regulator [Robertmurraya andreesenii]MDQ0157278.1 DNA-binding FadR family transcriptional regulator [Robertmurraya andreesenii]
MNTEAARDKVYIEIVRKIRRMIDEAGLHPGDKIPSERELSERLQVGRSSVREALRALELLGLIETRRGEGTFLRDARGNQLVQLLSTFILQDEKAVTDVEETKFLIEMDCLRLLLQRNNEEQLLNFRSKVEQMGDRLTDSEEQPEQSSIKEDEFFLSLVELADNHLMYRIWLILSDFYNSLNFKKDSIVKSDYLSLLDVLLASDEDAVIREYKRIRKLSST